MRRIAMGSEGDAVLDLEGHLGAEVVHQVLADAGKMTNHRYAKLLQLVRRADARQHQQVRRSDRPGAQHHLIGLDAEHLAAAFGFDAHGPAVFDHDPTDEYSAPYRQVQMVADRIEVRHRRAHPDPVGVVRGGQPETRRVQAVLVVRGAETGPDTGRVESLLDRWQGARLAAPD